MSNDSPARNIRYRIPIAPNSSTSPSDSSQPITNGPKIIPPAISPTMPGIRNRSARIGPSTTIANRTAIVASTVPISTPVPLRSRADIVTCRGVGQGSGRPASRRPCAGQGGSEHRCGDTRTRWVNVRFRDRHSTTRRPVPRTRPPTRSRRRRSSSRPSPTLAAGSARCATAPICAPLRENRRLKKAQRKADAQAQAHAKGVPCGRNHCSVPVCVDARHAEPAPAATGARGRRRPDRRCRHGTSSPGGEAPCRSAVRVRDLCQPGLRRGVRSGTCPAPPGASTLQVLGVRQPDLRERPHAERLARRVKDTFAQVVVCPRTSARSRRLAARRTGSSESR